MLLFISLLCCVHLVCFVVEQCNIISLLCICSLVCFVVLHEFAFANDDVH